jgi:hypothetical protein
MGVLYCTGNDREKSDQIKPLKNEEARDSRMRASS